jgi:hypothetical protein
LFLSEAIAAARASRDGRREKGHGKVNMLKDAGEEEYDEKPGLLVVAVRQKRQN